MIVTPDSIIIDHFIIIIDHFIRLADMESNRRP